MSHTPHDSAFGELHALQGVFSDACKRRRIRQPAHVLIVDDDTLTRRVVGGVLADTNAVITAEHASNAMANYLLYAPDVVFLDIGLPDIDGFTILEQLIALDPDAFVVMFSSHDDAATIQHALSIGAKGFVSKPFHKEALREYIYQSAIHHHKTDA